MIKPNKKGEDALFCLACTNSNFVHLVMELVLNSHVMLRVSFLNANGNQVKNEMVKIEGSEYAAWGVNDQYLMDMVMQKLGLVVRTE